jgi:putative Mg2+ transporter-C (MgtC) family protein
MDFAALLTEISGIDVLKLVLAVFVGGMIGIEREYRDKTAGFRTNILICLGATLFMMFSLRFGAPDDSVRIAAQIVSGVGFLGAGAIVREGKFIRGLTTASTIWFTAALGMGIGGGYFGLVLLATAAALLVLWLFPVFEEWIDNRREMRSYELHYENPAKAKSLEGVFKATNLKVFDYKQFKREGRTLSEWVAYGSPENHNKLVEKLFADAEIKEFNY